MRSLRLLRYIVLTSLEGRGHELKEYTLGVQVFERPQEYDPRDNPVVRLEARRLRLKLAEYYLSEGSQDAVIIDIPKGGYVPEFRFPSSPAMDTAPVETKRFGFTSKHAVVLSALALVAVIIGGITARRKPAAVIIRPSIAVIGFRDVSPAPQPVWISAGFAEALNLNLSAGQQLRTVPPENVAQMRIELAVRPQTTYGADLLQRMRKCLESDYVVAGAVSDQANRLTADVIVMDTRTGQTLTGIRDATPDNDVALLAQRCAEQIRALLGVRSAESSLRAFDDRVLEPYARGMERLRGGDALGARAYLEQAEAESPSNPFVHSGLAAALAVVGLDNRAEQEAKKALDDSTELGRLEQLEVEGRYAIMARQWDHAIRVYQALFTLLPDDLEYGLLLASAETRGGQAKQAFGVLKSLRSLPLPLGDDPRIDLAEAQAAGALSDFKRTEESARAGAEKAKTRGATIQYAKARLLESGAMQTLGQNGFAAIRAEARNICAEVGDRSCVAAAYRIEANDKATTGDLAAADRLYSASFKIASEIGCRLEQLNALTGFAFISLREGDLPAAEAYLRRAIVVGTEMGTQKTYQLSLSLAEVLADEGRLREARDLIVEATKTANQIGEQDGSAQAHSAMAHVLALENRPTEALPQYAAAVSTWRSVNDPYELRETLLELTDAQLHQSDIANARRSFEQARTLDNSQTPEFELAFADLSLAEGHLSDAVTHAQSALESSTTSGRQADRLRAAAILARAWLRQDKSSDAFALISKFPGPDTRKLPARSVVDFQIARSFVLAKVSKRAEAMRVIEETISFTSRAGIPQLQDRAMQAKKSLATLN